MMLRDAIRIVGLEYESVDLQRQAAEAKAEWLKEVGLGRKADTKERAASALHTRAYALRMLLDAAAEFGTHHGQVTAEDLQTLMPGGLP